MPTSTREKITLIVGKKGTVRACDLSKMLKISPQATHRHLARLQKEGLIAKIGRPPQSSYCAASARCLTRVPSAREIKNTVQRVLGTHPGVRLVCLFGSQAKGRARAESDIDLLVWLGEKECFDRNAIWEHWDRRTKTVPWASRASLIVRRLAPRIAIDTLLFDLPEEHLPLVNTKGVFQRIRRAVIEWRERNRSKKVPSFGHRHYWKYSADPGKRLHQMDFDLEIANVP